MSFAIVVVSAVPGKDIPNEKIGIPALRLRRFTGKQCTHQQDLYYPVECTLKQVHEYIDYYREFGPVPEGGNEPTAA